MPMGLVLAVLHGLGAAAQGGAVSAPNDHQSRLIVPQGIVDHSAYRLDTEVFGWNDAFTEVAGVCMEAMRGPLGKHRGETYLLVYRVGESLPKHNVTCHSITHADLPHNPLPLVEAKDYLWSIEESFLHMWPQRPRRHYKKGDIAVRAHWAAVPNEPGGALCTPWVSLAMTRAGQTRFMPYVPFDVSARCSLLKMTDVRTYWGRPDVAASMVRFDFSSHPHHEESARFVASAAWAQGKVPTIALHTPARASVSGLSTLKKALRQKGQLHEQRDAPQGQGPYVADVRGPRRWLPLALDALEQAGIELGTLVATDAPTPVKKATTPPPASLPSRRAVAQQRRQARDVARFGSLSDGSDEALNQLNASSQAGGESGLLADITFQHDPIEEAFPDEPEPKPAAPRPAAGGQSAEPPSAVLPQEAAVPQPPARGDDAIAIALRPAGAEQSPPLVRPVQSAPEAAAAPPKQAADPAPASSRYLQRWSPSAP